MVTVLLGPLGVISGSLPRPQWESLWLSVGVALAGLWVCTIVRSACEGLAFNQWTEQGGTTLGMISRKITSLTVVWAP